MTTLHDCREFQITHDAPIEFRRDTVGPIIARYLPGQIYRITEQNTEFVAYLCDNDAAKPIDPNAASSPGFETSSATARMSGRILTKEHG